MARGQTRAGGRDWNGTLLDHHILFLAIDMSQEKGNSMNSVGDDDPLLLRQRMVPSSELRIMLDKRQKRRGRKKLKGFYETQNSQISRFLIPLKALTNEDDTDLKNERRKKHKMLVDATLVATLIISAIQIYAAVESHSSSIALITVDSVIDIIAGIVIKWSNLKLRRIDTSRYPCGGARFRSIGNVCYAFLMSAANIYVASESVKAIVSFDGMSINNDPWSIIMPSVSLGIKIILFLVYLPIKDADSHIRILYEDQRNDIMLGIFGLTAFLLGSQIKWYVDPAGAIVLSLAIVYCWLRVARGLSADTTFLQFVTYKAMTFNDKIVMIDSCRAYHSGPKYFIEIDIVMDPETRLKNSHDVAEELQNMLEGLEDVDRAFVHVDYETDHKPEHPVRESS